jgi:malonyl-CoA decarboxylase
VHEIASWSELRSRLEPEDRYCYGFFHPSMEDEPLVFVEVALTDHIPRGIDEILRGERAIEAPESASCAIFYSISNCHRGLAGVSFGNFLIKQVATNLKLRFPQLKTFATISPACATGWCRLPSRTTGWRDCSPNLTPMQARKPALSSKPGPRNTSCNRKTAAASRSTEWRVFT